MLSGALDPLAARADIVSLQELHQSPYAQVAHAEGILEDQGLDIAVAHTVDERLARIESNQFHLLVHLQAAKRGEHPGGRRLVGSKNAVDIFVAQPVQKRLGLVYGRVLRRPRVFVVRQPGYDRLTCLFLFLDGGIDVVLEALLALVGAFRADLVTEKDEPGRRFALLLQNLEQMLGRQAPAMVVVGGNVLDRELLSFRGQAGIDDKDRNSLVDRFRHGRHHRVAMLRRQDNSLHVGRQVAIDDIELSLRFILLERSVPCRTSTAMC